MGHVKGESEVILGARAAWLVDHVVGLGAGYYILTSDLPLRNAEGEERVLKMGYGGMEMEWVLWPRSVVHLSLAGHLGLGSVKLRDPIEGSEADPDGDSIFVAEPTLSVEANVTEFARVTVGAGYRFVTGVDIAILTNGDLQAWFGQVALKFGAF
jgi:hypothetical protein